MPCKWIKEKSSCVLKNEDLNEKIQSGGIKYIDNKYDIDMISSYYRIGCIGNIENNLYR